MKDGVTIDACVMRDFMEEFLANVMGTSRVLVEDVTAGVGLAIDQGGKIKHEWLTTCQSPYFREWYAKQLYMGRIAEITPSIPEQHKKALLGLGLPPDGFDKVYIAVANNTRTRYIVSCDMDFFDPKLKKGDERAKSRARDDRRGAVCHYLRREMNIVVGTVIHAHAELLPH